MDRKLISWLLAGTMVSALLAGCIEKSKDANISREASKLKIKPVDPTTPLSLPADQLVYVGGRHILPRWETEWEKKMKRLARSGKSTGNPLLDVYDDYRDNHFDIFHITQPPSTSGIRTPAEFEPSQGYLMTWEQGSTSKDEQMLGEIVKGAWGVVPVIMIYAHAAHKVYLENELTALGIDSADLTDTSKIIWWQAEPDSQWIRDYGPISIVDPSDNLSFVDFRYYHFRPLDDRVATDLANDWGINVFRPDMDFAGGNLMTTSDGLCATTKVALYNNAHLPQSAIEDIFKQYMGCQAFLLPEPMSGEGTGHIDMFSKFGADDAVLVGEYTAAQDATNQGILDANAALFAATTTPSGKTITVTRIPMPDQTSQGGYLIFRTYTNSLALNNGSEKVILIPTYSQYTDNEAAALQSYDQVFPGWTQVKVDSEVIIPAGGATHCITLQIPLGNKTKMEADPGDLCGPGKWECAYSGCGNITAEGCCDGELAKSCEGGKLTISDCANDPSCGWDTTNNWYGCGTDGSDDPSGSYVKNCGVLTDAALPDLGPDLFPTECGDVTYEGCCDGETVWYCDNGTLGFYNCTALGFPGCGWNADGEFYDCGTDGSEDPSGSFPKACSEHFGDAGVPPTDGMITEGPPPILDSGVGCGDVGFEGCCDGDTLKFCQDNQLMTLDCSQSPSCGWQGEGGFYDCGTNGNPDPSGVFPKACGGGPPPDMSVTQDTGGQVPDQSMTFDTGGLESDLTVDGTTSKVDGTTGGGEEEDEGCGCKIATTSQAASAWPLFVLGLVVFLTRIRKRRANS